METLEARNFENFLSEGTLRHPSLNEKRRNAEYLNGQPCLLPESYFEFEDHFSKGFHTRSGEEFEKTEELKEA
jgi:hypothetical protein